jgi:PAS domain S-box-containing protein
MTDMLNAVSIMPSETIKQEDKRATGEHRQRASRLELVTFVSSAITQILDLQTLLQTVSDVVKNSLGLYHAHIYLLDSDMEYLVLAAGAGEAGREMIAKGHRIALKRPQSLVARAARTRSAVTVNDVTLEPGFLPNALLPNTRSELALPMTVGNELLGVLDVQSDVEGYFQEEEISIETILAQQIAIAVKNARAFAETQQQLALQTANARISEHLRDHTESLDDILDDVLSIILELFNADSVVMSGYDTSKDQWFGVTGVGNDMSREIARTFVDAGPRYPHALKALTSDAVIAVDDARLYPDFPAEYLDAKIGIKSVMVMPLKTGQIVERVIFLNYNASFHTFSTNEIVQARTLANQIATLIERNIAEARSRQNEKQLGNLVNHIPGIVYRCLLDQAWTMLYINENAASITGYPASDFIHNRVRSFASIIHPEDATRVADEIAQAVANQTDYELEYRIISADDTIRWVLERGEANYDSKQIAETLDGVIFDITDRQESAKAVHDLARNLEAVSEVGTTISTILDLDHLLLQVCELTKARFGLYHAHIYLLDETGQWLNLVSGAGEAGKVMKGRGHRIALDHPNSIVAKVARERVGFFSNDVTQSPSFLPNPLLPDTRSENAAPIIVGDQLIGVLDVQSTEFDRFNEIDVLTKTTLAAQIGVAVENARAFALRKAAEEEAKQRASELETVAMVSAAASTILDIEDLLMTVTELTKANFSLYHAHIYLIDEQNEYLRLAAGAGEPGSMMMQRGHRIAVNHPNSLVARAATRGFGVISNDVMQDPHFLPNPLLPETKAEMAIPLVLGTDVLGVLDVQSETINRFSDNDLLVFTTLGAQIAVAVQNARAVQQIILHERAIENSTSGLTIADARQPDLPLVYINPAFEHITGYTVAEAMGKNCRFLQADDRDQDAIREIRAAIQEKRNCIVTLRNYRKDGTRFWNELRLSPIFNNRGEVTHFVGVQTDITERKEIELQREVMLRQAEIQAAKLREIDRLKSQFLANMSHELRTPLNSIIGYSEILLDGDDGELPEEAVEDMQIIHNSGRHLLAIINEILDLAKIESGQMALTRRAADLGEIAREVLEASQILIKTDDVELRCVIEPNIPTLHLDPIRIRQVITNLVSNAVKFTEKGHVTLTCGFADQQHVFLEVSDTGIGMSEEDQKVIFEEFRQVDGSSTRRAGGTGLGLTITKRLIELHGGEIHVTSDLGVGSTFRILLPIASVEG